jgi:hypothetical protein
MQLTIDTSERLDDVLRVVGAAFGVTLSVGEDGDAAPATGHAPRSRARAGRASGSRRGARASRGRGNGPSTAEVRAWAREHGYAVSDRGRIPQEVFTAFAAARSDG